MALKIFLIRYIWRQAILISHCGFLCAQVYTPLPYSALWWEFVRTSNFSNCPEISFMSQCIRINCFMPFEIVLMCLYICRVWGTWTHLQHDGYPSYSHTKISTTKLTYTSWYFTKWSKLLHCWTTLMCSWYTLGECNNHKTTKWQQYLQLGLNRQYIYL